MEDELLYSAPDARAYFLLLRQKKVAKEKATPRSAPGGARSLALLGSPGGWLNSPLRGSDNASRLPPDRLRCSAPLRGTPKPAVYESLRSTPLFAKKPIAAIGVLGPLGGAEQRRVVGGLRLALSEARRAEFSQPPDCPSRAGNPAQRGADLGCPFSLATFFLDKQKESTPAGQRRNPAVQQRQTPARPSGAEHSGSATQHRPITRSPEHAQSR